MFWMPSQVARTFIDLCGTYESNGSLFECFFRDKSATAGVGVVVKFHHCAT